MDVGLSQTRAARYRRSPKGRAAFRRYYYSEKGRQWLKRIPLLDSFKRAQKKYRQSEKGKAMVVAAAAKRRALIKSSPDHITTNEWIEILRNADGKCSYCKKEVEKLTMDHVIPLSLGGAHDKYNIVAACGPCNYRKQAKLIVNA